MHFFRVRAPLVLLATTFITTVLAANFTGNAILIHSDYVGMTADVETFNSVIEDISNIDQSVSTGQTLFDAFTAVVSSIVQTFGPIDASNSEALVTTHVIPIYDNSLNKTLNLLTQEIGTFNGFLSIPNFGSDFELLLGQFENATQEMISAIEDKFSPDTVAQQATSAQSVLSNFVATTTVVSSFFASNNKYRNAIEDNFTPVDTVAQQEPLAQKLQSKLNAAIALFSS